MTTTNTLGDNDNDRSAGYEKWVIREAAIPKPATTIKVLAVSLLSRL